jgi:hypothetical protein
MQGLVGSGSNPFWAEKGTKGDGYEFGTTTGRQGTFDPANLAHARMAIDRLKALEGQYGERLDPQFSGETGLASNDATGYSDMLNARTEALNIRRLMGGGQPMNIKYGGVMGNG